MPTMAEKDPYLVTRCVTGGVCLDLRFSEVSYPASPLEMLLPAIKNPIKKPSFTPKLCGLLLGAVHGDGFDGDDGGSGGDKDCDIGGDDSNGGFNEKR